MTRKTIFPALLMLCTTFLANSQNWAEYVAEAALTKSQYAIEGEVLQAKSFVTDSPELVMTSHLVRIDKIFQNEHIEDERIRCGTIEILTHGGWVGERHAKVEPGPSGAMTIGARAIFLLYKTSYPGILHPDNKRVLRLPPGYSMLGLNDDYQNNRYPAADFPGHTFQTFGQLYDFLESKGFTWRTCEGARKRRNRNVIAGAAPATQSA